MISALFACGLLMLSSCAQAGQPTKPVDADPAIWVMRDADTTIYLFGTVHVLKPEIAWFNDEVKQAFDRSDELVLEMIEPAPEQMAGLVARLAYNPEGPTITSLLSPKDRARYISTAQREGVQWQNIDKFDPWMAAVTLSTTPLKRLGYDAKSGAEDVLNRAARDSGKRIVGLETAEQQLGYFDSLPRDLQVKYLNSAVEELPTMPRQFATLIKSWSKGDAQAIGREMNSSLDKTPELAKVLLYDRNRRWADWIVQRMEQPGTVFIAVGAGHLAGKGSVQDDLAQRGLKAERVPAN